jgi:hypothetical protein
MRLFTQVPLRDMVLRNPDLASHMLDRCYVRDPDLSEAYFHVFAGLCTHLHAEASNGGSIAGHSGALGISGALGSQSGILGDAVVRTKGVGADCLLQVALLRACKRRFCGHALHTHSISRSH